MYTGEKLSFTCLQKEAVYALHHKFSPQLGLALIGSVYKGEAEDSVHRKIYGGIYTRKSKVSQGKDFNIRGLETT